MITYEEFAALEERVEKLQRLVEQLADFVLPSPELSAEERAENEQALRDRPRRRG